MTMSFQPPRFCIDQIEHVLLLLAIPLLGWIKTTYGVRNLYSVIRTPYYSPVNAWSHHHHHHHHHQPTTLLPSRSPDHPHLIVHACRISQDLSNPSVAERPHVLPEGPIQPRGEDSLICEPGSLQRSLVGNTRAADPSGNTRAIPSTLVDHKPTNPTGLSVHGQ